MHSQIVRDKEGLLLVHLAMSQTIAANTTLYWYQNNIVSTRNKAHFVPLFSNLFLETTSATGSFVRVPRPSSHTTKLHLSHSSQASNNKSPRQQNYNTSLITVLPLNTTLVRNNHLRAQVNDKRLTLATKYPILAPKKKSNAARRL
jgi:hypothetical protein